MDVRQRSCAPRSTGVTGSSNDDARTFFARLGVFAGPFTFDAAGRVAADGLTSDALQLLGAMVDHSLVVVGADETYRLLDSLRAYAQECLKATAPSVRPDTLVWLAGSQTRVMQPMRTCAAQGRRPPSDNSVPRSLTRELTGVVLGGRGRQRGSQARASRRARTTRRNVPEIGRKRFEGVVVYARRAVRITSASGRATSGRVARHAPTHGGHGQTR